MVILYSSFKYAYLRQAIVGHTDLIARVKTVCFKREITFFKFVIDKRYADKTRMDLKKCYAVEDGRADNVRELLLIHDTYDRYELNMLMMPF